MQFSARFSSFSKNHRENRRVFIQIYFFLFFQSTILDLFFRISELWTLIYNQ